ncbi:MAG: hypothetical protein DRO04_00385 [Candidatus Iainarchaeum archaeon]|uniref:KaiC-like domain-containing protein n=1 Tax=Candidatus Iainarchaeum sp. TaxID=3101447 RepID=A0A497JJI6_9ARCH|nr:MAG: hypothetical protein DRO04_00385 [Candidatus Diapherotrites archaeon]
MVKWKEELKGIEKVPAGDAVLVTTSSRHYLDVKFFLLRKLLFQYKKGLYVSLNEPAKSLISELKNQGIKVERLSFVDAVAKEKSAFKQKVIFSNIEDLTDLEIDILDAMTEKPEFLIFDAVTTLLLYHTLGDSGKFIHFLIGKLKEAKIRSYFLNVDDLPQNKITEFITQFCDKLVFIQD